MAPGGPYRVHHTHRIISHHYILYYILKPLVLEMGHGLIMQTLGRIVLNVDRKCLKTNPHIPSKNWMWTSILRASPSGLALAHLGYYWGHGHTWRGNQTSNQTNSLEHQTSVGPINKIIRPLIITFRIPPKPTLL